MTTLRVRDPAVAGSFYPLDPRALRALVEETLRQAMPPADGPGRSPKVLVLPHAGYLYSGPVAAHGYTRLLQGRGRITRAVVVGPAHRRLDTAVAAPSADAFETPMGLVPVDRSARDELLAAGLVVVDDLAHTSEHSVEVHLPFLQVTLGEVQVLPLVVGEVSARAVAAVLDAAWGGPETVVIISTDLSHHHDQATAERLDRHTAAAILDKRPEAIGFEDACGVFPLRGLVLAAGQRRLDVELLDLRTSGDTSGTRDAVVGYGAFAFYEPAPAAGSTES